MKVHCQKLIALFLAVVLVISTVMVSALAWNNSDFTFIDEMIGKVGVVTIDELKAERNAWNTACVLSPLLIEPVKIVEDKDNHCQRLVGERSGQYVVRSNGKYPYVPSRGDVPADGPGNAPAIVPDASATGTNKWVKYDSFPPSGVKLIIVEKSALDQTVMGLKDRGDKCAAVKSGNYWVIVRDGMKPAFWCDKNGNPYVASAAPAMADNNFNYIVNDNSTTDNSQTVVDNKVIDTSNNTMTIINENGDKVTLNIDSLYWDDSTHSYTANTYNIENNTYNYYTYNITYNITNTYITYIGSNGAYQQDEYKYYYELPDGRSSEDLTAEEVGAMSFQFADVVNYARSATDTSLRALYHFDGNTEDSGYFSTQTKFAFDGGASITYMDSANFNGALYLDETGHSFDIDLPSNLGSGDFTVQFRYYQASMPDTLNNIQNSFAIGGYTLLRWDERNFYWGSSGSTVLTPVPIGSWAELAFVRHNGTLYFYINGLKVTSKVDTTGYQGKLMFSLGNTSRQYSMLDELRVVNFPIAKSGASYQCATAPLDTNLVLVLPDSAFPIADEYWEFKNLTAILKGDFTQGMKPTGWSLGSKNTSSAVAFYGGYTSCNISSTDSYSDFKIQSCGLYYTLPGSSLPSKPTTYYWSYIDTNGVVTSRNFTLYYNGGFYINGVGVGSDYDLGFCKFYASGSALYLGFGSGFKKDIIYAELATSPITDFEKISCIYSSADIKANTAAVQSAIPVNGYAVGGVRPTFPVRGDVWFPVEGRRITGCYIYDGAMWRSAGCRWYTGTRWIPIYAFDIYTLADCWDAADADDIDPTPPITSEQGFWNWWKGQWTDFRKWLEKNGGGSGGGGEELPPGTLPNLPGEDGNEGFSILDVVKSIIDALWNFVAGLFKTVLGGVGGFFSNLATGIDGFFSAFDGEDGVFGFATYGGADIWD